MVRKTKEEAEQTKQAIIDASLKVFCTKGYSRTTFDDIAASINLTKGAVYWHFKNKAELLTEMIRAKFYNNHEQIVKKFPEVKSLNDLRDLHLFLANMVLQDADYRKFLFFTLFQMEWSEAIVNTIAPAIREIRDLPLKQLKEVLTFIKKNGEIRATVDIDELSMTMLFMWRGALSYELSDLNVGEFPNVIKKSFDLIIDGVKEERL